MLDYTQIINSYDMATFCYIFVTLFGICIGSFLNVLIFRIPKKEEFVKTSSHCMTCGHKLAWYDNIPLISWITLLGKCRYCKVKLSPQYPIIEALNGLLWLLIFNVLGFSVDALLFALLTSGMLAMSVIDFKTFEISNGFQVYFGVLAVIYTALHYTEWASHLIGFFCVSLPLLAIYLISKGTALGGGDVKLMAVCGLYIGWQNILLALIFGCVIGSVIHLIRMWIFKAGRMLAMGPYLSMGIFLAGLWGTQFLTWYFTFIGLN